jgi:glycolate oxidase
MSVDDGSWTERLKNDLGNSVTFDPEVMLGYRCDQSLLTPAGMPLALVRARTTDDVVTTLTVAGAYGIPVVTRGAGTGLTGAANAIDGCIVLSLEQMASIIEIDTDARTATVQPGVINADLANAAAALGLWYVPDPEAALFRAWAVTSRPMQADRAAPNTA